MAAGRVLPVYAGFRRRALAHVVDLVLISFAACVLTVFLGRALRVEPGHAVTILTPGVMLALQLTYFPLFESSAMRATLGKYLLRLRVSDASGEPIGVGRAFGRGFARIVSNLTLGIGYLMTGFTARKQALHDTIAGTLVISRNAPADVVQRTPFGGPTTFLDEDAPPAWVGYGIGLLVVAALGGFVGFAWYLDRGDAAVRVQVAGIHEVAVETQRHIWAYRATHGAWPDLLADAEIPAHQEAGAVGIEVTLVPRQGSFILEFPNADPPLSGARLTYTPPGEDDDWRCVASGLTGAQLPPVPRGQPSFCHPAE